MNKADWYKHLIARADTAIEDEYYFESAFIAYGIIEDRLRSLVEKHGLEVGRKGVAAKIKVLTQQRSDALENVFELKGWDGGQYRSIGPTLNQVLSWCQVYRNPMQHILGDPREYKATIGDFHTDTSRDMAIEGVEIARKLSAAVMRWKKKRS